MKEIVIYCPCDFHKIPKYHKRYDGSTKTIAPCPKILFKPAPGVTGTISAQCGDSPCVKHTKRQSDGKYNGWYDVELNGLGGYTITPIPIPESFNEIEKVPVAVMEAT